MKKQPMILVPLTFDEVEQSIHVLENNVSVLERNIDYNPEVDADLRRQCQFVREQILATAFKLRQAFLDRGVCMTE